MAQIPLPWWSILLASAITTILAYLYFIYYYFLLYFFLSNNNEAPLHFHSSTIFLVSIESATLTEPKRTCNTRVLLLLLSFWEELPLKTVQAPLEGIVCCSVKYIWPIFFFLVANANARRYRL